MMKMSWTPYGLKSLTELEVRTKGKIIDTMESAAIVYLQQEGSTAFIVLRCTIYASCALQNGDFGDLGDLEKLEYWKSI